MQKWEEIEQKKEYLEGYINSKNGEALIKDQILQLRLDTMFPALQGDGMPRGSSQKDLSDYTAKIESLMEELEKEWVETANLLYCMSRFQDIFLFYCRYHSPKSHYRSCQ